MKILKYIYIENKYKNNIPFRILTDKSDRQRVGQKLALNLDGVLDDLVDALLAGLIHQVLEEQTGKVGVQALVPRDQLVAEGETGHQATLLQPEDGGETTGKEDSLNGSKGDDALGKAGVIGVDPLQRPVSLLLHGGNGFDRVEQVVLLDGISKKERGICFY